MRPTLTLDAHAALQHLAQTNDDYAHPLPHDVVPVERQADIRDELEHAGLIVKQDELDTVSDFTLTKQGRSYARTTAPAFKRQSLQYAVLLSVEQNQTALAPQLAIDPNIPSADTLLILETIKHLHAKGFIGGAQSHGGVGRAHLLPLGEDALASDYGPEDYLAIPDQSLLPQVAHHTDHSIHITASHGVAVATGTSRATSSNNTITVSANNTLDKFNELVTTLNTLPLKNDQDGTELDEEADTIRTALWRERVDIAQQVSTSFLITAVTVWGPQAVPHIGAFITWLGQCGYPL